MIGIGVGIDYALFIVTRYREALQDGLDPSVAVVRSIDTARPRGAVRGPHGRDLAARACSSWACDFMRGLAVGAAVGGARSRCWRSITLLPALLGFVGRNIDQLRAPASQASAKRGRAEAVALVPLEPRRAAPPVAARSSAACSSWSCSPSPFFSLRLGFADAGNQPDDRHHAPRLRPARRGLRPRLQRPAARRGRPRRAAPARRPTSLDARTTR